MAAPKVRDFHRSIAWDGEPDAGSLRGNVHEQKLCSKDAIEVMVKRWLAGTCLELGKHVRVIGGRQYLNSSWTFQFSGDPVTAARFAATAMKALRDESGEWIHK